MRICKGTTERGTNCKKRASTKPWLNPNYCNCHQKQAKKCVKQKSVNRKTKVCESKKGCNHLLDKNYRRIGSKSLRT